MHFEDCASNKNAVFLLHHFHPEELAIFSALFLAAKLNKWYNVNIWPHKSNQTQCRKVHGNLLVY